MEYNIVEQWLRRDPVRWFSGILAGLVAGAVAMGVAMLMSSAVGLEIWFPIKLMGSIILGPSATEIGGSFSSVIVGGLLFESICAFFGFIFAHFTFTNHLISLLAMGLVWATFKWIFIWNLFLQSFQSIFAAQIPAAPVFLICVTYGLALSSVAVFDRMLRR